MATGALFVALGGGGAYAAATQIDGHRIKVHSMPGNRIVPHSVGDGQLSLFNGDKIKAQSLPYGSLRINAGVAQLYVVPNDSSGNPQESKAQSTAPLFAANAPAIRANGATVSGTTALTCTDPNGCTLQAWAEDHSNEPQPGSGQAALYVGGGIVVTSVSTQGGNPAGGAETFQTAGQTPSNASLGNSPLFAIPKRSPLTSNYPGPPPSPGYQVPIYDPPTSNNQATVPAGFYIVHGTFSFIERLGKPSSSSASFAPSASALKELKHLRREAARRR